MRTLLILALSVPAFAQTYTLTGPLTASPGDTVRVTLSASGFVAGQWTPPANAALDPVQPQPLNKQVVCVGTTCAVFGASLAPVSGQFPDGTVFNSTPLGNLPIQTYSLTIPRTAAAGIVNVTVTSPLALDAVGTALPVTVQPLLIRVQANPLDLNGDGVVDLQDAQAAFDRWKTAQTQANFVVLEKVVNALQPIQ